MRCDQSPRWPDTWLTTYDVVDLLTGLATGCVSLLGVTAAGWMLALPGEPGAGGLLERDDAPAGVVRAACPRRPWPGCLPHRGARRAPDLEASPAVPAFSAALSGGFPVGVRPCRCGFVRSPPRPEPVQPHAGPMSRRTSRAPAPSRSRHPRHRCSIVQRRGPARETSTFAALTSPHGHRQAKGVVAARPTSTAEAFSRYGPYARDSNLRLTDVAERP